MKNNRYVLLAYWAFVFRYDILKRHLNVSSPAPKVHISDSHDLISRIIIDKTDKMIGGKSQTVER